MRKFSEFSGVIDLIREIGERVEVSFENLFFPKLFLLQFAVDCRDNFHHFHRSTSFVRRPQPWPIRDKIDSGCSTGRSKGERYRLGAIVFPRLGCLGSIFHRITVNDVSSRRNAVGNVARSVVSVSVKSGERTPPLALALVSRYVVLMRHPRVSSLQSWPPPLPPLR